MLLTVGMDNFQQEVLERKGLVLLDFWAEWCTPCHILSPIIEQIAQESQGKVTVGKVDVEENPAMTGMFGIRGIPTVILFKDGKPVEQIVGVRSKADYLKAIDQHSQG